MRAWGLGDVREGYHVNQGLIYSQPLLDHPELDKYTQHPSNYDVVCDLLGGADKPRHAEFNFREAPEGAGQRAMNVHHDAVKSQAICLLPVSFASVLTDLPCVYRPWTAV